MIEVKFTGKVVSNNSETKTGNNGEYTKTEVVLQASTDNGYTDTLALVCFGENAIKVKDIPIGTTLHIRGSVGSREWNGKHYTQVNLLNWEVQQEEQVQNKCKPEPKQAPQQKQQPKPQEFTPQSENDGLPF